MQKPVVLAAVAHPDDIEFMLAGTLLLLRDAGAEIHMWNVLTGSCGTSSLPRDEIVAIRWREAQAAAALAGATIHPPLYDDIGIFYDAPTLARVAAVFRSIRPTILLTHPPDDYMEDHEQVCRLLVTAAFTRGMVNYTTHPDHPPCPGPVAVYHALPHGLGDAMGVPVRPDFCITIDSVLEAKTRMLACHHSQQEWLDRSQRMNRYLQEMHSQAAEVGRLYGSGSAAEGWRRHARLGFCAGDFNPLEDLLRAYLVATPAKGG